MKKTISLFALAVLLISSTYLFAADGQKNETAARTPKKTIFNACSEFFSTFDRPFTRPGNKQNFWNATSDWLKTINKD